jgi:hypothetical protein
MKGCTVLFINGIGGCSSWACVQSISPSPVHDFVSAGLPSCDESFGRINVPEKKKL